MKKALSVLCLFAMLLSLATVMTVGTSAKTVDNSKYYGVYATTAPTIDGEIDKIWDDTIAMPFGNAEYGYIKVMWDGTTDEGTLYLLAVVNGCEEVDFVVSARFYDNTAAAWTWGGNFDIHVDKTGGYNKSNRKAWNKSSVTVAAPTNDPRCGVSTTATGFVAEIAFTMKLNPSSPNNSNARGFKHGGFYGIGAFVDGSYTAEKSVGLDVDNIEKASGYIYGVKMVCLHKDPVLETVTTAPTFTAVGKGNYKCSYCGTSVEKSIPATTIQWLGHQVQETIPAGATTTSMRLVSQIKDLEAFSKVGYEISATMGTSLENMTNVGKTVTAEMDVVYKSIKAGTETVLPENGGEYLAAIVVKDIPLKDADGNDLYVTFTVKPYTVNPDGTRNYMTGTNSFTFTLKAGQPVK